MIIGLNENVTYKGVVFHIQTEDRGSSKPVVVSTLFYRGMIILEERRDYSEFVSSGDVEEKIRKIKNELHEKVKKNLLNGSYDRRIKEYFQSLKKDKKSDSSPSVNNKELIKLFQDVIIPSLSDNLGVSLSKEDVGYILKDISTINGKTEKERFLSLCSIIYKRVSNRCSKEEFKNLAKTWLKHEKTQDVSYKYRDRFRRMLEKVILQDLNIAIGSSLANALIDKVMEELHPMFFKKPEAFDIIIRRIIKSGIVQKKTSPQWQKEKEVVWKERHRNLSLSGDKIG